MSIEEVVPAYSKVWFKILRIAECPGLRIWLWEPGLGSQGGLPRGGTT